ncbi:MAG: zinc ABC transporter substrate-binding protein [Planctomycetota bacterium]
MSPTNPRTVLAVFRLPALVALGIAATGCGGGSKQAGTGGGDGKLTVVATTGMVADLARRVGGDSVRVSQLMGPGVDPHLYKATRDDVAAVLSADLVLYSGLMLEGKMADTLERAGADRPVIAVTETLPSDRLLSPDDASGHPDPHVWMDATLWAECVDAARTALTQLRPDAADGFQANADAYVAEITALGDYAERVIATIPESQRVLVTSHDAFGYFGRAYGLQVEGVQGISTESEAGLKRVNDLVGMLVDRGVPAVFVESSVSPKSVRALIDGAAAREAEVAIGGELFSDAMGPVDTYEGTYLGMLDHNVTTVCRALGGEASAGGMAGKLAAAAASDSVEETAAP